MAGKEHYSDAQRAAIVATVLDGGMSAPDASAAAAAGELGNVGAFTIPASTVRHIAGAAKRDRAAERPTTANEETAEDTTAVLDAAETRLRAIVDRESKRLASERAPDLQRTYWLARVAHELEGLRKRRQSNGPRPADPIRRKDKRKPWELRATGLDDADDVVGRLIASERAANGNGAGA